MDHDLAVSEREILRGVLRRERRGTLVASASSVLHQSCEALVPLAIGLTVDRAVDSGSETSIALAVGGILGLFALLAVGGGVAYWVLTAIIQREAHHLRVAAARSLLRTLPGHEDRSPGDLTSVLTADVAAVAAAPRTWFLVSSGIAGLLVTAAVLLSIDVWLGLFLIVGAPALVLGVERISPWLERHLFHRQRTGGLAAAVAAELVAALRTLRGFGGEPEGARRYVLASRRSLEASLGAAHASAVVGGAGLLANAVLTVGTAAAAGILAFDGTITLGQLVTVVALASFAAAPASRVATGISQRSASRASARRLAPLLGAAAAVAEPPGPAPGPLLLREVTVGGATSIDIAVSPGEMLGVVAGTPGLAAALVDVLAGRSRPDEGRATLGDVGLDALGPTRRHVVVEPHVPFLLGRTLEAALDTGRHDALHAGVTGDALRAMWLEDLPTVLSEGGANLSGGQRQRVALARAIAAAPDLLVLHDPLTAVDPVTEHHAASGLYRLRSNAAVGTVIVTTSPALLARCDRVVHLRDGHPARTGRHADLLAETAYATAVDR